MATRTKTDLVTLPFRSHFERQPPSRRRARRGAAGRPRGAKAIVLPYTSQDLPGALNHRNDCGPACVRMALDFLDLAPGVAVDALAAQVDAADDGTTADDLASLAQTYGAAATALVLPVTALPAPPAILLVRYNGFRRESVENTRYWDASANNESYRHWMWWLGNETIDGQVMTVWNDPLYLAGNGQNVLHTLEEFNNAFAPYGGFHFAVTFPGIAEGPPPDEKPVVVVAFDEGGVRMRTAPTTQDPNNIVKLLPQNHRFTVLESAASTPIKLSGSGNNYWLRVRADVDGTPREGFVAAWLVRQVTGEEGAAGPTPKPPAAAYTWQDVINATAAVALRAGQDLQDWLNRVGYWSAFNNSLRAQPYGGPAVEGWPLAEEYRRKIADLLKLSSDQIVAEVIAAQQEAEARQKAKQTGRIVGVHGAPGIGAPPRDKWNSWIATLQDMGVKWFKQCDDGDPNQRFIFEWACKLKQAGIEPIIRYFKDKQFPNPLPDPYFEKMRLYANAGIAWAEIGNEPNLDYEWQDHWNNRIDYNNPEVIRLLAEGWVHDARRALDAGVRPAFYAFGPTDWRGGMHPRLSSVFFQSRVAIYLAENRRDETVDIFKRGGWFAVHCATYEQSDDFDPFRPDGTFWDITLRGYEIVRKCFRDTFGAVLDVDAIPILSTEGGVFTPESTSMSGHIRLNTDEEHAQRVASMFKWLEVNSPLQAMCPWCLSAQEFGGPFDARFHNDGWFKRADGGVRARPVVQAMKDLRASNQRAAPRTRSARAVAAPSDETLRALREIGIYELPRLKKAARPKTKAAKAKRPAKPKAEAKAKAKVKAKTVKKAKTTKAG